MYSHVVPTKYRKALYQKAQSGFYMTSVDKIEAHHNAVPALFDMPERFTIMDKFEDVRQVLTIGAPSLEEVTGPEEAAEIARIANDEMAELVAKYPDRFVAGVAALPMNNMDAALRETERAITELKLKGVQVYTPIEGKPLDSPEFMPLYDIMAGNNLPIWIHPQRGRNTSDYKNEDYSKYRIFHIFGWPYETTAAMSRLVFSGVLDKHPNLRFITHHCGGMIPFFSQRLADQAQTMANEGYAEERLSLKGTPIDYFKMFYGDTAIGSVAALMCGHSFFGADHILFGTDMPFGAGDKTAQTIDTIEQMAIPDSDKKKIFGGNAKRLLNLTP